jgi:hypothetical protein
MSRVVLLAALAAALPRSVRAEEPPPLPPPESAPELATRAEIEPPVARPPWTGREAIWGGVGLIIAGVATLIIVTPALCSSNLFNSPTPPAGAPTASGPDPRTTCIEGTIGGAAGGVALGAILLAVGEIQRATYKEWLKKHPMFGAISAGASSAGPTAGLRLEF